MSPPGWLPADLLLYGELLVLLSGVFLYDSVAAAGGTIGLVNEPGRVVFRVERGAVQ